MGGVEVRRKAMKKQETRRVEGAQRAQVEPPVEGNGG